MRIGRFLLVAFLAGAAFAADPNQKRGFSPNEVYQLGELDHVNVFNGNVVITLPVGQVYQAGPQLQYQFMLTYNSKVWDYRIQEFRYNDTCVQDALPCSLRYGVPESTSTAGLGWTLSLGRLVLPRTVAPVHGWLYIGPDGAAHEFTYAIDPPATAFPPPFGIVRARTTDSSYLELRRDDPTAPEVWFPDGQIRKFDAQGRLTEIRDRHGNWVRVAYTATQWIVTDGFGASVARTHYVSLVDKSALYNEVDRGNFRQLVSSVDLASFDNTPDDPNDGGDRAVYQFAYEDHWVGRGGGGYRVDEAPDDGDLEADDLPTLCITAPFLKSIQLPDQTTYGAAYKTITGDASGPEPPACVAQPGDAFSVLDADSGVIESLNLPTGGSIEWTHGPAYRMNLQSCVNGEGYATSYVGVTTRSYKDRNGAELMKWTYTPRLETVDDEIPATCEGEFGLIPAPAEQFSNEVEVWSGPAASGGRKLRTTHYFSVYPEGQNPGAGGATPNGFRPSEYGRPFTHHDPVGSEAGGDLRLLSSETADCTAACDVIQRSYVLYETDPSPARANARVAAQRTVEVKDTGCNGVPCYTDTARALWDGFGHYEQAVVSSNIPGTPVKTSFTDYVPDPANWLLNLYTTSWVRQTTASTAVAAKSVSTFDGLTGVLKSVRTLKATGTNPDTLATSSADVLTVWCRDGNVLAGQRGYVTSERYFGGDSGSVPAGDPCSASRTTGNYFLGHTYTFAGAALTGHKAQYTGISHPSVDEVFDRNTGRARIVRDTAGVATTFGFDASGRMTATRPLGRVGTVYTYAPAAVPPRITVAQECPSGASASPCTPDMLTESRLYFDGLGRLTQDVRLFAAGEWSSTWTTYDAPGRKKTATVPVGMSSADAADVPSGAPATTWNYDVLGRPTLETRPDQTTSSWIYRGSRETERRTGNEKRSVEVMNGLGQLVEVRQRASAADSDIVTLYRYDVGGRLAVVQMMAPDGAIQRRTFDYDGRGFLRWESQPEAGMTSYTYDARGHVTAKDQSAAKTQFDLRFDYDAAERLVTLSGRNPRHDQPGEPQFRIMKEFTFASDNAGTDLRKGKLWKAARYNYPTPNFGLDEDTYRIEDAYSYRDAVGRKTHRTTTITSLDRAGGDPLVLKSVDMAVAYNALDLPVNIQYPTCLDCGLPGQDPDRSAMTHAYQYGRLRSIAGFVSQITYWPSGLRRDLAHSNGRTDTQVVSGMPRPAAILFGPATTERCLRPSFTSQPGNATVAAGGGSTTLSVVVTGTGPFEYEWVRVSDWATVGTSQSITVSVTANETFYVVVKNACGFEESERATVTLGGCSIPTLPRVDAVRQPDGSWLLKPGDLSAGSNRQYAWRRLPDLTPIATTETVAAPAPTTSTTYRLTVSDGCGSATSEVTLAPPPAIAQAGLVATAGIGAVQVTVSWPAVANASHYVVERRSGSVWEAIVHDQPGSPFVDHGVAANRSYAYRVFAVVSGGASTGYSNSDVATTRSFAQAVQGQGLSVAPVDEMLAAVNSVRAAAGWAPVTWSNILAASDPVPQPAVRVLERHVTAARARMNEALSALGVPLREFRNKLLIGLPIRAEDVNEVQQRAY